MEQSVWWKGWAIYKPEIMFSKAEEALFHG